MGALCRTFHEEPLARPCVSLTEPSNNHPKPVHEGSRDPALGNRAGFSFGERHRSSPIPGAKKGKLL
jgi:hypothetical protein